MLEGISINLRCIWWWQPLFLMSNPVVELDGLPFPGKWGKRIIPYPPGRHHIRVFFAYLGQKECGRAEMDIEIPAGGQVKLMYSPPFTIMQAGKLRIVA